MLDIWSIYRRFALLTTITLLESVICYSVMGESVSSLRYRMDPASTPGIKVR